MVKLVFVNSDPFIPCPLFAHLAPVELISNKFQSRGAGSLYIVGCSICWQHYQFHEWSYLSIWTHFEIHRHLNFTMTRFYFFSWWRNMVIPISRDKNGSLVSQAKTFLIKIKRCSHTNFIWVIIFEHLDAFWNSSTFKLLHDQVLGFTRLKK